MDATTILSTVDKEKGWLQDTLRKLVQQESPSEDRPAVNAAVDLVELWSRNMGGRAKRHKQRQFGDVLEIRFGPARSSRKPILLLGHLDTVWPLGTLRTMPWRESDGRFHGPGVLDMKAGIAMALAAIRILQQLGISRPITQDLNSDEAVGSQVSGPITERLALASSAVLV